MSLPCPQRSRYVSASIASQRGLPPNVRHREILSPVRYSVGRGKVCVPPAPSHQGRTACYAEHSPRRKRCPFLSSDGSHSDVSHPPGLYVSGVPPYESDEDAVFETLILGPYVKDRQSISMKRVPFTQVFENHFQPENVAPRFSSWRDGVIPSVSSLRSFYDSLPPTPPGSDASGLKQNVRKCLSILETRVSLMNALKRRCSQNEPLLRVLRRLFRNVFLFSMYARRWAGPDTPYPISRREANRNVGSQKPVSPSLVGSSIKVSRKGDVFVVPFDDSLEPSDEVQSGKVMSMMNSYLYSVYLCIESLEREEWKVLLKTSLFLAIPKPCLDGSYWPSHELLWDSLFCERASVSAGTTCIRQISSDLLHTCELLLPIAYKTRPNWMRYEGSIDEIQ